VLKTAYATVDDIIQEVTLAEESSLEGICQLLKRENDKLKSPVIEKITAILRRWGKVAASEIKTQVEGL